MQQERKITLILENHYKDDFWQYPEFAQKMDVFCKLVDSIDHPYFGVNYDPSNTYLAGEDPIELLKLVSHRVVTMHASDRYLKEGTLEDLRKEEGGKEGYAKRLSHGEIGKGLNDYDAIFTILKAVGFDGWISIEDGVDGMDQLERSVSFLRKKLAHYWHSPVGTAIAVRLVGRRYVSDLSVIPGQCLTLFRNQTISKPITWYYESGGFVSITMHSCRKPVMAPRKKMLLLGRY